MPVAPPVFGGSRARKPWAKASGTVDRRQRGRAGQRDRAQVLAEEPFCRQCLEQGRRVASKVVDHIVNQEDWPLGKPGWDDRKNKQALCDPCHDTKSTAERAASREARAEHN